jgi:hypothetical protein
MNAPPLTSNDAFYPQVISIIFIIADNSMIDMTVL